MTKVVIVAISLFLLDGAYLLYRSNPELFTKTEKFTGVVTNVDESCHADGICSVRVDDKWVIGLQGGLRPPNFPEVIRGEVIGIVFNQDMDLGKRVEVYARKYYDSRDVMNKYSIYGSKKYYLRVIQ